MLNTISGLLGDGTIIVPTDYESIQTVTVGSGGAPSVTFSSIPSTYTHLQIRAIARSTIAGTNADNIALRINADSGNNYTTHALRGSNQEATASAFANLSYGYIPSTSPSSGNLSNTFCGAVIDLLDYRNTNKTKVLRTLSGFDENNSSGNTGAANIQLSSVLWNSTSAVTSIEFVNSGNFAQYTTFALYGIK
jgi:hypothetical protein